MPHAELKYSADLTLDPSALMRGIEETIASHDAGAGAVKGRAYPAEIFQHSHLIVNLTLLPKPHRDAEFVSDLLRALEATIQSHLREACYLSLQIDFNPSSYVTRRYEPA